MSRHLIKSLIFPGIALFIISGCKKESAECGNGTIEGDELCDGGDFGRDNCQEHLYYSGYLTCTDSCDAVLENQCYGGCGNGTREELDEVVNEECDGSDFGGDNCEMHGFDYGDPACKPDCTLDLSGCVNAVCGNGEIEPVEDCEPGMEIDKTCEDFGFNAGDVDCFASGTADECHYDTSGCQTWECGNGVIDPGEDCDFDSEGNELLDEKTCETQGYDSGDLHCVPADFEEIPRRCKFDVSECSGYECGNGILEGDEQCEDGVEITTTCMDEGFEGGDLGCMTDGTCLFDYSACTGGCGNGLQEGEEECDGDDLADQDCASYSGGTLTGPLRCKSDCTFDLSLCEDA